MSTTYTAHVEFGPAVTKPELKESDIKLVLGEYKYESTDPGVALDALFDTIPELVEAYEKKNSVRFTVLVGEEPVYYSFHDARRNVVYRWADHWSNYYQDTDGFQVVEGGDGVHLLKEVPNRAIVALLKSVDQRKAA